MKKGLMFVFILFFIFCYTFHGFAGEKEDIEEAKALAKTFFKGTVIDEFNKTPIPGMYEMMVGNNIMYIFPKEGYIFFGQLYSKDGKNITAERQKKLMAEKLRKLPLDKAIQLSKGTRHTVIEFTDPECPFCRRVHTYLSTIPKQDLTMYVYLFPLEQIHKKARKLSLYILCSKDKVKAFDDALSGRLDDDVKIPEGCDVKEAEKKLEEQKKIALSMGVTGTPVLYIDGNYVGGADIPRIDSLLK